MDLHNKTKDELLKELLIENNTLKEACEKILDEKKQVEQKLSKINEKNRLKIEFLSSMTHEIRTPICGINGFSLLLQDDYLESSEIKQYAKIINNSVLRLGNSIEDIFDFLLIDTGRKADISEANVVMIIENIYSSFKSIVEKKGINLSVKNFLPLKEFFINTDQHLIWKIFAKLVSNALNLTSKGSIEIGCVLNMVSDPVELEFYVKDTGMGIPQEKIHEIFKPYNILYVYDLPRTEATGLELFIAKSYTELLGGTIRLESEEGKGTTFYFTVPQQPPLSSELMSDSFSQKPTD